MLTKYLTILMLLGVSVRGSFVLKDLNSAVDLETMRLAKSDLIRKYMNKSIDPCEDFYQFACGNWHTHHPATVDGDTDEYVLFYNNFDHILAALLNEPIEKFSESERKVKIFYDSCWNMSSAKSSDYRQDMKKLIGEFGQMPALEGKYWPHQQFDWIKTVGEISYKYDIGIIFGYMVSDDPDDPTANAISLDSYLLFDFPDITVKTINENKINVEENLKDFLGLTTKTAKRTANNIVDFAVKLWRASQGDGEAYKTTFEEMHQKYSHSLDIMRLVKTSFGSIPGNEVYNTNPNYVAALDNIMNKTSKRVVANYIFYALLHQFLLEPITDKTVLGDECLLETKGHFLRYLNNMIYRRFHLNATEQAIHQIWQGVTMTLQTVLESSQLSWFDDDSREAALEKLHLMGLYIGSYKETNFEEFYKELSFNSTDFMENLKSIASFSANQTRKSLNERRDDKHVAFNDFTAFYKFQANIVSIPVYQLLTDILWSKYVPNAVNYGRFGRLAGHEIMHALSGRGRLFNRFGVFIDGMYKKGIENSYDERRQCYYDQYHNFTLDNKPLPQDVSQTENLADNGGIYLAYHAYLRWLADADRTQDELDMETLPHLNYTNKQLFFIGYSQAFCSDNYPVGRFERVRESAHSPDEFRGFVSLLNFGEFAKEFNCPSGSPMNPHKKCSIY